MKIEISILIFNVKLLPYDLSMWPRKTRNDGTEHWQQLITSLTRIVYLRPELKTTSLTAVIYIWLDRRTTALTRIVKFLCLAHFPYHKTHDIYLFIHFLKYYRLEPNYRIIFKLSSQLL